MSANKSRVLAALEAADEVHDQFDELVERAKDDPGAPFTPEVVASLVELKLRDRPTFENLRARLKDAGVRMRAFDEIIAPPETSSGGKPKQADVLVELVQAADLFHVADGTGYADIQVAGHRETWAIRSRGFRRWLARAFYESTNGAPNSEAMQSALSVIEANAHFDAPEREIHNRVAGHDGGLYLDLADREWRAIEIDRHGWRVVSNPPIRFRRAAGMRHLPVPERGGSIDMLRPYLNVQSDTDFVLAVTWMLAVLRNQGPYPVLVLAGEQGSAKSTFTGILRALLDPNAAPLRALPREDRDLFIAATNGHMLAFDNVSGLASWISDTLCRLATGGGFAVRQLYTDQDEVLFEAVRPVILNGIEDIVTRPDLADRALFLGLQPIPEEKRRPERELWDAFSRDCPRILGTLLDAVVIGLQRLPGVRLARHPRMADFALWASACETAFWPSGTFLSAYAGNREDAVDSVIEADPVASTVRSWMAPSRTEWSGTASELLGALNDHAEDVVRHAKTWPSTPRGLSGRVRRAATFLRSVGIDIQFLKTGHRRTRTITITRELEREVNLASAPSAQPVDGKRDGESDLIAGRAAQHDAEASGRSTDGRPNGQRLKAAPAYGPVDGADDADDDLEERVAIVEFEGGLPRSEAEVVARARSEGEPGADS